MRCDAMPRRAPACAALPPRRCAASFLVIGTKRRVANLPFFFEAISWPEPQYGIFGHPALRRLRGSAPLRDDVRKGQTDRHTDGDDK
jgi:hypothetical protein